jgi:type I site-specific restriction-modification system R (restriction) subunit
MSPSWSFVCSSWPSCEPFLPTRAAQQGHTKNTKDTRGATKKRECGPSGAVASDEVIDIFGAAGLKKPDISILSDEFIAEVRAVPRRNLAIALLRKLLAGEIQQRQRRNVVQGRSFAAIFEEASAVTRTGRWKPHRRSKS